MSMTLIPLVISALAIGFWAAMLVNFVQNDRIPPNQRFYWILGFVFLSLLTAGYYYFTVYRERR